MINIFSTPSLFIDIFTILGWMIGGIFGVLYFLNQSVRERRKENDDLADGLINRLKETVDQQSKDMATMQTTMQEHSTQRDAEIKELQASLNHLQGRNSVLEDILKGRDPQQVAVMSEAPEIFKIARETNGYAHANNEALTHLTETFEKFINTLTPILAQAELDKV